MKKIVQKANKQLKVPAERLDAMLALGYVEVNEKGNPIKQKAPNVVKALKEENAALKKQNKELSAKVDELTAAVGEAH